MHDLEVTPSHPKPWGSYLGVDMVSWVLLGTGLWHCHMSWTKDPLWADPRWVVDSFQINWQRAVFFWVPEWACSTTLGQSTTVMMETANSNALKCRKVRNVQKANLGLLEAPTEHFATWCVGQQDRWGWLPWELQSSSAILKFTCLFDIAGPGSLVDQGREESPES